MKTLRRNSIFSLMTIVTLVLFACTGGQTVDDKVKTASSLTPQEAPEAPQAAAPSKKFVMPPPPELDVVKMPESPHKQLSIVEIKPPETIAESGIYDTGNESAAVLQNPSDALAGFPLDRRKAVDWVAALKQGLINPRSSMAEEGEKLTMDIDVIMKDTQNMPYVRFPHDVHSEWLDCNNCHDEIFTPANNGNPVTMTKIYQGQYCGVCHDKVAFSLFICERCHSVPHQDSPRQWW